MPTDRSKRAVIATIATLLWLGYMVVGLLVRYDDLPPWMTLRRDDDVAEREQEQHYGRPHVEPHAQHVVGRVDAHVLGHPRAHPAQ